MSTHTHTHTQVNDIYKKKKKEMILPFFLKQKYFPMPCPGIDQKWTSFENLFPLLSLEFNDQNGHQHNNVALDLCPCLTYLFYLVFG